MYKLLLISTLLLLAGCQQPNEALYQNLEFINQSDLAEYKIMRVSMKNAINEISPNSHLRVTEQQIESIDSLFHAAQEQLSGSKNNREIQTLLTTWESYLTKEFNYDEPFFKLLPLGFKSYQLMAFVKLNKDANQVMRHVSRYINATEIKFDRLNIIVEPEHTSIKLGQTYKAKVYFSATSSISPKIVQLLLDNTPIEVGDDGTGYLEIKPERKGNYIYKISSKAKHNNIFKEFYTLERELTFNVE